MKKAKYCENVECERKKQIKGNKINYEENKAKKKNILIDTKNRLMVTREKEFGGAGLKGSIVQ